MMNEPLAASACYFASSVCLSLTNKAVFSRSDFDFPLSVLASQALVTLALLLLFSETRLGPVVRFDPKLARKMLPITLLFAAMLWTSSKALRYCSVPVVTIFKNLSVVAITGYERLVYSDRSSVGVLLSLLCMVAGSVVAAAGDLQFSSVGYGWMLLNVFCTVCHLAAVRAWLRAEASSTSKTFHNQLFALAIFSAGALAQGELGFARRLLQMNPSFQAGLLLSTVLGLLINLSSFWALRVTSGTTYSFVGASNKIPAALLGHFLFSSDLTAVGWLGVLFGLASGLGFSASKYRLHQAAQKAAEDTPAGTPQPPARGRRNSGSELELGLDGGAGEARRRGAAAQEVELEPPGPGLDGAELHAPNRMQLASRDRRTSSDAAV